MNVPEQLKSYPCDDSYQSPLAEQGYWEESGQLWLIEPVERVEEDANVQFLQVGRPGVDKTGFGYRKGRPGFWAYHRMVEERFQYLAPSLALFLEGWLSGRITV
jgi:hypothetical protein